MPDRGYPASVIAANGTGTISWRPDSRQDWVVSQITTKADNVGSGARCEIRKNGRRVALLIPTGDTAGNPPPIEQHSSDVLDVHWTGAVAGAAIEVSTVIYEIVAG